MNTVVGQLSNSMLNILQKLSMGILCSQLADQITLSVNDSLYLLLKYKTTAEFTKLVQLYY